MEAALKLLRKQAVYKTEIPKKKRSKEMTGSPVLPVSDRSLGTSTKNKLEKRARITRTISQSCAPYFLRISPKYTHIL